ncbi:enolase C-terminal domain-like protein [Isoptericola sp. BMS4]|uniref:enolase C-terminal domain-like protein n=1 Tax=Isoptericola sp. BMS4 TaxID=2527875 RepID=UPI00141E4F76|nr:enolase C-terminal domain-like protein [Isoptericola sp. BMS4]
MTRPEARLDGLDVVVCRVPTEAPEADGTLSWDATTVVLVQARSGSTTGLGWTYADASAAGVVTGTLADEVVGRDALDVPGAHEAMSRAVRNAGRPGVCACAISAVDVALWDLKARLLDVSLAGLLGRVRESVPVYGSGGFTTQDEATTRRQVEAWLGEDGVGAVKLKIGESWGTRVARDLERVALVRDVVGADVDVFVDANGAYGVGQARRVTRALDEHAVTWFEEPVTSDDLPGLARVRDASRADVTAGEYGWTLGYFERMLAAGAVDCLQADVTRCGGYTTWLGVASLARAHHTDVSAHCAPQLSAHVACAVPNARHLEWFADHVRVDALLLDGTLRPTGGRVRPDPDRAGHGLSLDPAGVARYRVA